MSRNILEYPITPDEVHSAVKRAFDDHAVKQLIGGNDGYILHHIGETLAQNPEFLGAVVEACRIKVSS